MSTIRDIAREAGVSIGTVSHVLNHPDRVAQATRSKVERAMQEAGWQPNVAAQTLRQRHNQPAASASVKTVEENACQHPIPAHDEAC